MQRIWLSLIILLTSTWCNCLSAHTMHDNVYVKLFSKESSIKNVDIQSFMILKPLNILLNKENKLVISKYGNKISLLTNNKNKQTLPKRFYLYPILHEPLCLKVIKSTKRCYMGNIGVFSSNSSIILTNKVPINDYLNSVVSSELPINWPLEAVKAQAVAVQTYLFYTLNTNKIIEDSTQNQFYGGVEYVNRKYGTSIASVKNILMLDNKHNPINALYHSTCNSTTHSNNEIFGGKTDEHLRPVKCIYHDGSPFANTKTFIIFKNKLLSELNSSEIAFIRDKSKKLLKIKLDNKIYKTYEFWVYIGSRLGWGYVPGVSYNVSCNKNICEFKSRGAGHGVGMCQWGARNMALKGIDYKHILHYYYKNIEIK